MSSLTNPLAIATLSTASANARLAARLSALFPALLTRTVQGDLFIKVAPGNLRSLLTFLKAHTGTQYTQLRDITVVDYPERKQRFELVYSLLSPANHRRLTLLVPASESTSVPSVTDIYPSAGWYEREAWDRFGLLFQGHPDLRRRLTDYGFKGHPLRKDFPVTGFLEVRYDERNKRIVYEGLSLAQEYRLFTLDTPW
jgi:NADH-quinone oxidoreductase subunit C